MVSRRSALMTYAAIASTPITAVAAGCGSTVAPRPPVARPVTYLTGFGTYGREGYAWVADAKGYFAEAALRVAIQPGAAGDANLAALAAGRAQFATIDYSGALVRAGNGAFGPFRVVAAINTQTLIALMAQPSRGIARPADLAGRHIGQAAGAVPRTLFPAYAKLAGVDPRGVTWTEMPPSSLPAVLAAGRVDAIGQFVVGQPAVQAAIHRPPVVLPYGDYLGDLYGNVVVSTVDIVKNDPDLVRRFVNALMRGLRYAVDNPDEAGQLLHEAVPTTPAAVAAAELELMRSYVATAQPGHGLGAFDASRVARGIALLQSIGLYPTAFDPSQLVDFEAAVA
jgi:NitT/TauT family transport system substrate-binding protein